MREIYFVHNTTVRYMTNTEDKITSDPEILIDSFFTFESAKEYLNMLVEAQKNIEREGFKGEFEFGKNSKNNCQLFVPGWKMISDKILYGVKTRVVFMGETAETYRFITTGTITD